MTRPASPSLVKPNRPGLPRSGPALAARVTDGDIFGVGGHHFARLPIALLRAIAARGVRGLRYTAWAGGLPLEMLLEAEAIGSIDLCFSSLDIFGLPPRFRAIAEAEAVPVRDWTALAMIQALRAGQQNLPSLPFPLPVGSAMMERIPGAATVADPLTGAPVGAIPPLRLDTVVLHAPRADASGNVQIVGAKALDLAMVGAARQVLVTVDEIVPVGELAQTGRQTVLTRNQVSAIALVPGGAWPTSCLPFYATDYAALAAALQPEASLAQSLALPPSGVPVHLRQCRRRYRRAHLPARFPAIHTAPEMPSIDEILAIRIAAELDNQSFASAGAVSPLANVAYRLAKATHAPEMIIATLSCGHLDIAPSPMILSLIESLDAETAAAHAGGDDTYSTYYQAGAVTHEIIGAAQIDRFGSVNNLAIAAQEGRLHPPARTRRHGGCREHAPRLCALRHAPFAAHLRRACRFRQFRPWPPDRDERSAAGYRTGKALVFSDLCVFRLDPETRELVVAEILPGVTRERLIEATGFTVRFDAETASIFRRPDREPSTYCATGSIRLACAGLNSSARASAAA